ncbi:MAG: HEAT repeat domain-containing protein [Coriobacteriia bacterium]|nr:HEAT repeat domain-containing protein [Coriobacteriia bacterium]
MPNGQAESAHVPIPVERFVKQLVVTLKAVLLYPRASSIPRENAQEAVGVLRGVLRGGSDMRLAVTKSALYFGDYPVFEGQPAFDAFARELYNRNLAEVRFHTGATAEDILHFLGVLAHSPSEVAEVGGFEARLWDLGVDCVTVKETAARIVDSTGEGAEVPESEAWPPAPSSIDRLLAEAYGSKPREQRLLVRVIEDPKAVGPFLSATIVASGIAAAAERLEEMAHVVAQQKQERRGSLYRALREALEDLEPNVRRQLLAEHVLPGARSDNAVAAVVRQIDVDEACQSLVESFALSELDAEGLARAIRYLALISLAERDEVFNAAGAAMRTQGMDEESIAEVFEQASPSRLTVAPGGRAATEEQDSEGILKLLDLAPTTVATRFKDDPEVVRLQEESRRGVTDGDVVRSLVTLVAVDTRGPAFTAMMALLEDMIEVLIDRGEYEVASDAAESLMAAAREQDLEAVRRDRIVGVLRKLADADAMREVTNAMRMYRQGTPEYDACRRLLEVLGSQAIDPLLEVLADEPDMAARKALIDLISELAPSFIDELAQRVTDPRWYVVRNVVAILGRTRRPEILPALERTLRHSDDRVRRETIRALSGVPDSLANKMLIAALDDSDAQNVQLAARFLGATQLRGAVDALQRVAAGEGRGNRENGPRVEAIEALGRMGARDSLPLLESLAGRRSIIGSSRTKELKSAAEMAITTIKTASRTGEEGQKHE